jgi:TRAP-type mannitol/chloroaromatic compound transport system substrate-binding protein
MIGRRRLLANAGGVIAATATAALVDAPAVIAQPKIQWRLSTAWPPALKLMHGSAVRLAKNVEELSGGRFRIEVFAGDQIMPAFGAFEAASQGKIEAFMGAPSYWADKEPAIEWFQSVPFGMNPEGMAAWYYHGDGLKLWQETYAAFNLMPRQGPAFAPQMAGWFRKKINSAADYKGLKIRIGAGLGNKVVTKAGGTAVLIPAAGIFAAFERGVIDAAEWVGPHDDMELGLHNSARYYYYPGWHEPGTVAEFSFNRKAYEALPVDLRQILDHTIEAEQTYFIGDYQAKNATALARLKTEFKGKVEILQLPTAALRELKKLSSEVIREQSEKSPQAKKVNASFAKFQALVGPWDHVAEGAYHQLVAGVS